MQPLTFAGSGPLTVLAIGAHPDDIEIGCGGTLLRLIAEGRIGRAVWVVLTGTEERAREARESAGAFLAGVAEIDFVAREFRDGFLPYDGGQVKEFFEELKARVEPDLILTHRREDLHQDHRLAAELTWNTFRDHLIVEYEIPKYEGDLGSPSLFVELDEPTARRKIELVLSCFPTQASRRWFTESTLWAILRLRGIEAGGGDGLAEAFTARKIVLRPGRSD